MCIHFKRFLNNGEMVNKLIGFRKLLELGTGGCYNLKSIIYHVGTSGDGHCYTIEIDGEQLHTKNAYIYIIL